MADGEADEIVPVSQQHGFAEAMLRGGRDLSAKIESGVYGVGQVAAVLKACPLPPGRQVRVGRPVGPRVDRTNRLWS